MNPNFKEIGQSFIGQYYDLYDDPAKKPEIAKFYNDQSMLTLEGTELQGKEAVVAKHMAITGTRHAVSRMDCQPTIDGGVLIMVVGQLKNEGEEKILAYTQTFLLKPHMGSFYICHEIFQLALHNF